MTGIYLPISCAATPSADDHFSFRAELLDRSDSSVLVKMDDGSVREVFAYGAEFSPVDGKGFITIDMTRQRAAAEGIIA